MSASLVDTPLLPGVDGSINAVTEPFLLPCPSRCFCVQQLGSLLFSLIRNLVFNLLGRLSWSHLPNSSFSPLVPSDLSAQTVMLKLTFKTWVHPQSPDYISGSKINMTA